MDSFALGQDELSPEILVRLARQPTPAVHPSPTQIDRLKSDRAIVEANLLKEDTYYGINTGFGYLANVKIPESDLGSLQLNLIRSHACGVGEKASKDLVRALLILRAHTFLLGHSGITLRCLETILLFLKHDILPSIPVKGSVGASGDLAPLAHLALGLIGEGEVVFSGAQISTKDALKSCGIDPLVPAPKEGLSLINGTHFMTAIAAFAYCEAKNLAANADIGAALSLTAIRGTKAAFDPRIQQIRPHEGQGIVAKNIRDLLGGSDEIAMSHADCDKVQDPYSFRCVSQVHGATRDTLKFVHEKLMVELNSVTDNPLIFPNGEIISGGNFHGQPIAFAMDFLAIAVAELGSISERRIEKITNPALSGLPAFAAEHAGLNSGYMIPHVVSAALASENKILCHPASVDSIPTSADKEDHVSMGPIAARKAREVNRNVRDILAIEFLASCQALNLLLPLQSSKVTSVFFHAVRDLSPYMNEDRSLHHDIKAIADSVEQGHFVKLAKNEGLELYH